MTEDDQVKELALKLYQLTNVSWIVDWEKIPTEASKEYLVVAAYVLNLVEEAERKREIQVLGQCALGTADDEFRRRVMHRLAELKKK